MLKQQVISELPFALFSKRVLAWNHSADESDFHMNGFARRLVLTQEQKEMAYSKAIIIDFWRRSETTWTV